MKALFLISIFFTGFLNAQIVNIPDANFKAALISSGVDTNGDGEIQVSEALNQTYIDITSESTTPQIISLQGISSFQNLTNFSFGGMPLLTSLDLSGLNSLTSITMGNLPLTTLNLSYLPNITQIYLSGMNSLTSFSMAGNTSILTISIMNNLSLGNLNVSGCSVLNRLEVDNASYGSEMFFNSVNLTGCNALKILTINKTSLATLDVSNCAALESFYYEDNHVPNLDFSGFTHLQSLHASSNMGNSNLVSINANGCTSLNNLYFGYNDHLQSVYFKNGMNEATIFLFNCPALTFLCVDDSQISTVQSLLNSFNMSSVVCSSYCSFVPGGNYNTITGHISFDADNNGCDAADPIRPNIKVDIGSPVVGATVTNASGNYTLYTGAGSIQWTPNLENPTWFNVTPTTANTIFADSNNNSYSQNFCLSANGTHNDLETVISPLEPSRPGFDASYKIVFKNKGNQTLSGNVNLSFDDSRLDFISALPSVSAVGTNNLDWAFSNLQPFESRTIYLIFNVNSAVETPAVNVGDTLDFTTVVTPLSGDEFPSDNTFNYHQTVVGSFDPNSITCLEGPIVSPSEIGSYLHYAINFENSGNYPAQNVVVKDIIDTTKYDINSLQLMNTSHNCYTRITGNVVEFIFENINLAAANGNPPVGGHGDVLFKIKSNSSLTAGDQVSKTGKIYFDYNAPVNTNIAQTTFQNLSSSIHEMDKSITVYPNPANSVINIHCDSILDTVQLFDIQGRLLETLLESSANATLDISGKTNGVYFLKIKTEKGSKVEKVIKE